MIGWPKTREAALEAAHKLLVLARLRKPVYAQGGYISGPGWRVGDVPILLSRGCTFITSAQVEAFGGWEKLHEAFPDTDFELVLSAEEVRAAGQRWLEKLNAVGE